MSERSRMIVQFGSDDFFVDGYVESRRDFGGVALSARPMDKTRE